MEQKLKLIYGESDWVATRLTPRPYYPPSSFFDKNNALTTPLTNADVNPKPFKPIYISGVEGIGVQIDTIQINKHKGRKSLSKERCLTVKLALAYPFESLGFTQRVNAVWNPAFNTWDIPILSQSKGSALSEVWQRIEEAFFEIQWISATLELHWNYSISEKDSSALRNRINRLNNFWESGEINYDTSVPDLVYPHFSQIELEEKAAKHFQRLYPAKNVRPKLKTLCVNYLRHETSAYHLLLRSLPQDKDRQSGYRDAFSKINREIAKYYPYLEEECLRQITLREQTKA